VADETKKRQKTNVNGSIVFNPIFIIGKDVPHRQPASNVKNTALAILLDVVFDTLIFPVLLSDRLSTFIKHFLYQPDRSAELITRFFVFDARFFKYMRHNRG